MDVKTHLHGDRVRERTPAHVNQKLDHLTARSIAGATSAGREGIEGRIAELEREWDIDRALMVTFAVLGSITAHLGQTSVGWRTLFRTQMAFLCYHAVAGWCPPVAVLRRLGFRTTREIALERTALDRALDYKGEAARGPVS